MDEKDFRKKDRLPIHRMNLQLTEELLAFKAKKRPCIFLSQHLFNEDKERVRSLAKNKDNLIESSQVFFADLQYRNRTIT